MVLNALKTFIYGSVRYWFCRLFYPASPCIESYKYFMDHGYSRYPYHYAAKHLETLPEIHAGGDNKLKYVLHKGKKLYFPGSFSNDKIRKIYIALKIEQDPESAHKYVDSVEELRDKTLLDVGASEGLIALDAVDVALHIYLFECLPIWVEALEATFAPWKEKVSIIIKNVSDKNDDHNITLDRFLEENKHVENLFLKMDIEGSERYALEGGKGVFSMNGVVEFAICTYHKKDDMKVISRFLDRHGCTYTPRNGLLYTGHAFRIGVLRGNNKRINNL